MNCLACGQQLRTDARFCPQCGRSTADAPARASVAPGADAAAGASAVDPLGATVNPDDASLAAAFAEGKRRAAEILGEATTSPDPKVVAAPPGTPWGETVADERGAPVRVVSPLAGSHLNLRAMLDVPAEAAKSDAAEPSGRPAVSGRSGTAVMEARAPVPSAAAPASSGVRGTFSPTTPLPVAAPLSAPQLATLDPSRRAPASAPQMVESRPFSSSPQGSPQQAPSFAPVAYAPAAPAVSPSVRAAPVAPIEPFAVGRPVLVTWSNGQRYPATVLQLSATHVLVAFGDGQRHWVERVFVTA
jgi:hypothetical protein